MVKKRNGAKETKHFGIATLGGILAGIVSGGVLIFILSAVASRMNDPAAAVLPMGLAALAVSALITGRISCAMWGNTSLFPPLAAGSVYALIVAATGLGIPGSTLDVWVRCLGIPAVLLLSLVGGLIFRRGNKRRHRH